MPAKKKRTGVVAETARTKKLFSPGKVSRLVQMILADPDLAEAVRRNPERFAELYDEQPRATAVPTGQELDAVKRFGKDYGAIAKTLAIDENRARVLYGKVARYLGELALSRR